MTRALKTTSLDLGHLDFPEGWLIGPRSFLVDRIVPDLEQVWLPPGRTGGGTISFHEGDQQFVPPKAGNRLKAALRQPARRRLDVTGSAIDLRGNEPQNWAHFLNIHLSLLALAAKALGQPWSDFEILLPAKMPGYIRTLTEVIGLSVHFTDDIIEAHGVSVSCPDLNTIRGERGAVLRDVNISPVAAALASGRLQGDAGPKRVFLPRKDTRALNNGDEIDIFLQSQGFQTLYVEDLDVGAQLALFQSAEVVVAVHGASLAPLLYRSPDAAPFTLIEIFPVGHITNVYRAITAEIGGRWCGVRGKIAPEHVPEIYELEGPYLKHSLLNFEADVESLRLALQKSDL
jgi:capsular polysaccharide biosynthesis protein